MKQTKRLISCLAAAALFCNGAFVSPASLPVNAAAAEPTAAAAAPAAVRPDAATPSGSCGESLYWRLTENGVLIISGTGDMEDYSQDEHGISHKIEPWNGIAKQIKEIRVEEGVTSISGSAFHGSGYENVETLRRLEGLVQIYMPDLKYLREEPARRYSLASDYPQVARAAIREMVRQTGPAVLDESGLLKRGVLIRHLILPGRLEDARDAIDFAADEFPAGSVLFSLMSQYTPMPGLEAFPELQRPITREENEALIHYMRVRGLAGFWQEGEAATGDMIPAWDLTGVCQN